MRNLVFILGAPRSGTTLVYGMLTRNQDKIGGILKEGHLYNGLFKKRYNLNNYLDHPFYREIFSKEKITEIFNQSTNHKKFFENSIDLYLSLHDKELFIEKTPQHTLYFDQIINDYPDINIILLERKSHAVINSMITVRNSNFFGIPIPKIISDLYLYKYVASVFKYYRYFREFNKIGNYKNSVIIKYEDIVLEKIDYKSMLENFLKVEMNEIFIYRPFSKEVDHKRYELDKSRIEGYKNSMPLFAQKIITILFEPKSKLQKLVSLTFRTFIFEPYSYLRLKLD